MAQKKQPELTLRLPEDLLRRLLLLSEAEGRTLNNEFLLLARNAVAYQERAKGKLDPRALAALDITPYLPEEKAGDEEKS